MPCGLEFILECGPDECSALDVVNRQVGIVLRHDTVIVQPGSQRDAGAGGLRYPPRLADPLVVASHHPVPQVVHDHWGHLGGCINRARVSEWPLQRITFYAIATTHGTPSGPGVKGSRAMVRDHQAVPDHSLSGSLIRFRGRWLHRSKQRRLDCRSDGFSTRSKLEVRF